MGDEVLDYLPSSVENLICIFSRHREKLEGISRSLYSLICISYQNGYLVEHEKRRLRIATRRECTGLERISLRVERLVVIYIRISWKEQTIYSYISLLQLQWH